MKKIRVLHFYNIMNTGGAETFIMNVYRNIDRNEYQFDFLCSSDKKGFYDDEIEKLGGNVFHYKISKNPFKTIINMKRIIDKYGPYDVFHSPMMFFSSLICILGKICNVKNIIVHSHSASDMKKVTFARKLYINISRLIINRFATNKLACGVDAAKYLFGTEKDVVICYNSIDYDKFQINYEFEIAAIKKKYKIKQDLIIGEVASFIPVKNHDYYIGLAKKLIKNKMKFKIILIGEGVLKAQFIKKVKENNLNNYFIIMGATDKIPIYMNLIDIYMMPSLYEGFPLSLIEAVACGKKCVVSNNITTELQVFGKQVNFFDLNEEIDLNLFKRESFDKKMIEKNLKDNKFTIEATVELLENIYGG